MFWNVFHTGSDAEIQTMLSIGPSLAVGIVPELNEAYLHIDVHLGPIIFGISFPRKAYWSAP